MNKNNYKITTITSEEFRHNYNMRTSKEMADLYKVSMATINRTAKKLGCTRTRIGLKLRVV